MIENNLHNMNTINNKNNLNSLINSSRYNVLFMMADQLRYDVLDNPKVITPNLDRLRSEALTMDNFYANTPVCVPSRCCIATGRYPHSTRIRENHTPLEGNREIHIFRAMKQAGYSIAYSGKNHLLRPDEFENFDFAVTEETLKQHPQKAEINRISREKSQSVGSYGFRCASYHEVGLENTPAYCFTSQMILYLSERAGKIDNDERPFFGFLSIVEPHYPHVVPKEIWDMYEGVEFDIPEVYENDISEKAKRYAVKQKAQHSDEATYEEKQTYLRAYYSFVTLYDIQVGRIVDSLKENNLYDNTLFMVTTDHGEFAFNHNMYKKDLVLIEDLLHIPMIISLPKKLREERMKYSDDNTVYGLAEQVDIMPTIMDVCGIEPPFGVQGKSMLQLLMGKKACTSENECASKKACTSENECASEKVCTRLTEHKDAVYAEICPPWLYNPFATYDEHLKYWQGHGKDEVGAPFNVPGDFCKSIRTEKYRYVWYRTGEEELYDLSVDAGCTHNLIAECQLVSEDDARHILKTATELKLRLLEWNALYEDPLDPRLVAKLQEQYSCWKIHDAGNWNDWLPFWIEMNTSFRNES